VAASAEPRPLRADAERNRRRILDAAREVFAARGAEASVDEIARAAGVGMGTLYRRFPTKDELLEAVIRDRLAHLAARLEEVAGVGDPWDAFAGAMEILAELVGRDRALYDLLQVQPSLLTGVTAERKGLRAALRPALERAQAAGVVRDDVTIDDLPSLAAVAARLPAWRLERQPGLWRRYLGVVLDGLRPDGATALRHAPPRG
jgi:AcrR family transcriptional regulator